MSRPQFLADHDLNEHIIDGVLRREPSAIFSRARDVSLQKRSDPELLGYAAEHGFILVSHDVNTMWGFAKERVAAGQQMTGLFLVRQTAPIAPIIENLVLICSASEAEEWIRVIQLLPL